MFESQFSINSLPFLDDYRIHGMMVFPATAYLEMALAAAVETFGEGSHVLEEVVVHEALVLPEEDVRTVQLILKPEDSGTASFQIFGLTADEEDEQVSWRLHATGKLCIGQRDRNIIVPAEMPQVSLEEVQARCQEEISGREYYQILQEHGLQFGPGFQAIEKLWRREGEALGQIQLPEALVSEVGTYQLHPAFLDSGFQLVAATLPGDGKRATEANIYLPMGLDSFRFHGRLSTRLWGHALLQQGDGLNEETVAGDVRLLDEAGQVVVEVMGLRFKRADREVLLQATQERLNNWLYEVEWQPKVPVELEASLGAESAGPARKLADLCRPGWRRGRTGGAFGGAWRDLCDGFS